MKKHFFLLFLFFAGSCRADIDEKYTLVSCMPKIGYLRVYGYDSIGDDNKSDGIPYNSGDNQTCKINGDTYEISVVYDAIRSRGLCGGEGGGHLDILKNGKEIVDNLTFNNACSQNAKLVEYNVKTTQLNVTLWDYVETKHITIEKMGFINDDDVNEISHSITSFHPGFDCKKAQKLLDKLICLDETLTELDQLMTIEYNWLNSYLPPAEKKALLNEQRQWLKSRNETCQIPNKNITPTDETQKSKNVGCLQDIYTKRMDELLSRKNLFLKKQEVTQG